jgi:predicted nucleic acid-binding protein
VGRLDTNVLIRHLTGAPPTHARRATAFLGRAEELLLPDLIVAEVVYVLESFYEVERARVAELVRAIICYSPIIVVDEPLPLRARGLRARRSRIRGRLSRRLRRGERRWGDRVARPRRVATVRRVGPS